MSRHETCFSFQSSGHKYRPLDGLPGLGVLRLFCPRCGRVIPANQAYNVEAWSAVELPDEVTKEIGNPNEPVH